MNKFSRAILSSFLVFSIFAVSLPSVGFAQTPAAMSTSDPYAKGLAAMEEKLEARRAELGIPGMSLVIVKDDKIIYMKGLGYKDFEKKVPVTPDTQFAIGSATKAFTALSVLMSQDEGKLSLDDSPKKALPYFKMYDPETDKNITIRDLLSHSSGLNRTDIAMITGRLNRAELIQVAAQAKPTAKLREKFQYQNIMFTAAGEIVATVQKTPWEKFVTDRVFKPLGMTNSTMSMKQMAKTKDHSFGYNYNFDTKATERLPYRDIDEVAPAGSINSSAWDMAEWLRFVMNGGSANGKRLVSQAGFEEWLKPQMKNGSTNYGLGWFLQTWNGLKVVQHGGNIDGFNSLVAMIPEKKLGFVMLTNVSGSPLGGELMPLIWHNVLGETKSPEAVKLPLAAMKFMAGKYRLEAAKMDIEVKIENDNLVMVVPGQPPYTLERTGPRQFNLSGAPDGFAVKFSPEQDQATELQLTQPNGNFKLPRINADGTTGTKPEAVAAEPAVNITVDELMQKAIEAAGGEANLRKVNTRVSTFSIDMENQGVQGFGTSYAKAPNRSATEITMTALGKTIATGFDFFDGSGGEEVYSFAPLEKYTGKRLEDIRLGADLYGPLNWKTNYKKVEIARIGKVGDEEAYIVNYEPETGSKFTEFYSTKTFMLLRRTGTIPSSTSGVSTPYSIAFSDYRDVDGIKVAFKTINFTPGNGSMVTIIKDVKHNTPIDDKMFAPRKLK